MSHPDPATILDAALGFIPKSAHLQGCRACGEELGRVEERLRELRAHYAALEEPSTEGLEARVMRALHAAPAAAPPRPLTARLFALAAAALVMGALVWWAIATRQRAAEPAVRPEPKPRPQEPAPKEPPPEEIAARVNGEVVTWTQVREKHKEIKPSEVTEELRRSIRAQLAEELLFRQFIERKKITVTEAEVDAALEEDVRTYGGREVYDRFVRLRFGTPTKAREARRLELLYQHLWTYVRENLTADPELLQAGFVADETPEATLREYYDSHRSAFEGVEKISFMRVGLLFSSPEEEEKKRALLESVRRRYEAGAEFSMLAFFYSDLRRAKDFRDMGVTRKDLEGIYSAETILYLFERLKESEVSPIVKDGRTLNLFKMEQKIVQKAQSYEEARDRIREHFVNDLREKNRAKFRDLLRRQAKLEPPDLFGAPR